MTIFLRRNQASGLMRITGGIKSSSKKGKADSIRWSVFFCWSSLGSMIWAFARVQTAFLSFNTSLLCASIRSALDLGLSSDRLNETKPSNNLMLPCP